MHRWLKLLLQIMVVEIPSWWEKPLYRAAFFLFTCHCTLLSSKVPQQGLETNPFAIPELTGLYKEVEKVVAAPLSRQPSIPPAAQPQSLSGEPSGPCRVVFQSTPASDPRAEAAFGGEPGWGWAGLTAAAPGLDAVSFAGDAADTPPPLRFGAETSAIRALMLVSRGEPADLATLVDGAAAFRLRLAPDGGPAPDAGAAEGALTAQFLPGRWQVVTLGLAEPSGLAGLFFGGSAGRPEWRRNWRGEIAEIVGFDAPPDADVRAGVANYLAVRWGFGGHPATPGQRQAAVDAGLRYGLVWGSVLFVK